MTAVGAGVAVVAAGGGAALATTGQGSSSLITSAVTTGAVTQTVEASGTIASSTKTDVTFAADGTVAEVDVKNGQTVREGQVLAKLDTSTLQSAVDSARATLASARQQLADDESGQTSAASSTGSAASTGTGSSTGSYSSAAVSTDSAGETALTGTSEPGGTPTGSAGSPGGTGTTNGSANGSTTSLAGLIRQLQAAQKNVVSAQSAVDAGQRAVDAAQQIVDAAIKTNAGLRDTQQSACAVGTTDATACSSARADYEAYADTLSADMDDLDTAISGQDGAVKALDEAIATLDTLLGKLPAAASSNSGGTGGTGSTAGTGSSAGGSGSSVPSGGQGTGSGNGTTGSGGLSSTGQEGNSASSAQVASAAQLAADQASIDSAKAQLKLAKQNLAAATLTSPRAGRVGSISLSAGSRSSGGSITIVGNGNQIVTIDVPLSQIDQVKAGQPASIAVDGRTGALHATVTSVGILSSTSGSLTTFPVTVTLADGSPALHNGVGADVTITTGTAAHALLVPNSAITTVGSRHIVTIVRAGKASTATVTLGLIGADSSQVTGGLSAGDEVELADPDQGLPSSATSSSTTGGFGRVVFPAGSLPAGGFGGFRPGG